MIPPSDGYLVGDGPESVVSFPLSALRMPSNKLHPKHTRLHAHVFVCAYNSWARSVLGAQRSFGPSGLKWTRRSSRPPGTKSASRSPDGPSRQGLFFLCRSQRALIRVAVESPWIQTQQKEGLRPRRNPHEPAPLRLVRWSRRDFQLAWC